MGIGFHSLRLRGALALGRGFAGWWLRAGSEHQASAAAETRLAVCGGLCCVSRLAGFAVMHESIPYRAAVKSSKGGRPSITTDGSFWISGTLCGNAGRGRVASQRAIAEITYAIGPVRLK